MFSFKKKNSLHLAISQESPESGDMKERLFFHDLINQTHGLMLFLEHKELAEKSISKDEILLMKKEIKTLQSLIKDHYDFKHKNLNQTYNWMPINIAKHAFDSLANTYLVNMSVTVTTKHSGLNSEEDMIYYPCYYRILTNMIKNISESGCSQVAVNFIISDEELIIETRNQIHKSVDQNSSEYLSHIILDEKVRPLKSLGLDSIHHLAEAHGGSFSFEITERTWINHLKLPIKKAGEFIKTDKIPA